MSSYWPRSLENRAALRTACATLIAVLLSFALHLESPYWSGMSVVIVANLYTGTIIDKAMMRIIGTIAGAILGFFIAGMVANSFFLYILSCFLVITISVYHYNLSKYGYAYLLGALAAFIVISQIAVNPQNAFYVAIWRPVEIGIGVLIAALSAYAIFPNHLKDNIFIQVHDIFDDFAAEFTQLEQSLIHGKLAFKELDEINLKIKKKIRKAVELIDALNHEIGITKERVDELRAFLDSFYNLARQLQYLIITAPQANDFNAIHTLPLPSVFAAIAHDLALIKTTFLNQTDSLIHLKTTQALEDMAEQFQSQRKNYLAKSDFIYSFIHFLQQIQQCFILMSSLLAKAPSKTAPSPPMINRQQRLQMDFDLIKQSIKAGLSVILALGFWLVSNWPGGINGIISSLIISIRKNLYEMTHISIHRVLGCFLGGGVALMSLFILEMTLADFIGILFFSVWGFSYLMFKSTKYSYIGLQANIALVISLAQEGGPPISLDPPLQRLAGIFIGIMASFLIANIFWRADIWTILNRYLNKLYYYISLNLHQVLIPQEQNSLHDLASFFWITRGVIEQLQAEDLNERQQTQLGELTQRFESLVITQAALSHILVTIDRNQANASASALGFDLPAVAQDLVQLYIQHDSQKALILNKNLQEFLSNIEQHPAYGSISDKDLRNLLAYINALIQLSVRSRVLITPKRFIKLPLNLKVIEK